VSQKATVVCCFIFRFALFAKVSSLQFLTCLNRVIRIVNFVKMSTLIPRLLDRLCEDFSAYRKFPLYHRDVQTCTGTSERIWQGCLWTEGWTTRFFREKIKALTTIWWTRSLSQDWITFQICIRRLATHICYF